MNRVALTSSSRRQVRPTPGRGRSTAGQAPRPEERIVRTPLGAALPAAAWAALLGLAVVVLLVVVGWAAAPDNGLSASQVAAAGAQGWLLANFTDLQITDGVLPAGTLGLTPLGLALVPACVLYRSGSWAARSADVRSWPDAARTAGILTVVYAVLTVTTAVFAVTTAVTPAVPSALVGSAGLALLAGGAGVLRGAGLWGRLPRTLPGEVVAAARGAVGGLATVVLGGALLLVASWLAHGSRVTDLWSALGPDPAGGVLLLLLCVALVPNAVLWAAAYCVGPGFAVGVGTTVAPTGVVVGAVPALPVLGGLPSAGDAPAVSLVGLALPVVAGTVVALVVVRDRRLQALAPAQTGLVAALAGLAGGVLLGILVAVSAGGLGGGRMAELGPSALRVGLVAGLEMAAVAAVVGWEWRRHSGRRTDVTIRL